MFTMQKQRHRQQAGQRIREYWSCIKQQKRRKNALRKMTAVDVGYAMHQDADFAGFA
jgi:hypothetical protein